MGLEVGSPHCRSALARCGADGPPCRRLHSHKAHHDARVYAVVLELLRKLSPYLPALRARSSSLGDPLERVLVSIPLKLAEAERPSIDGALR